LGKRLVDIFDAVAYRISLAVDGFSSAGAHAAEAQASRLTKAFKETNTLSKPGGCVWSGDLEIPFKEKLV